LPQPFIVVRPERFVLLKSITTFLNSLGGADDRAALGTDEIQLATAALLFHTIAIDGTVSETEMERLKPFLMSHFGLSEAELNRLLDEAELREREAVGIHRYTSVLRDRLSSEEKRRIILAMWQLVYADGELTPLEDNFIWRAAELLAVPPRERMELKHIVRGGADGA
jgi:uncharacterized tellurite resistance protein B-like protein